MNHHPQVLDGYLVLRQIQVPTLGLPTKVGDQGVVGGQTETGSEGGMGGHRQWVAHWWNSNLAEWQDLLESAVGAFWVWAFS